VWYGCAFHRSTVPPFHRSTVPPLRRFTGSPLSGRQGIQYLLQLLRPLRGLIGVARRARLRKEWRVAHIMARGVTALEPFALRGPKVVDRRGVGIVRLRVCLAAQPRDEPLVYGIQIAIRALDGRRQALLLIGRGGRAARIARSHGSGVALNGIALGTR
jgi:hypothetical protein